MGPLPGRLEDICGSYDESIRIWNALSGKELQKLEGHSSYVTRVGFSPDGTKVVSGSDDKSIRIFDSLTGKELPKHSKPVSSVTSSPSGSVVRQCRRVDSMDKALGEQKTCSSSALLTVCRIIGTTSTVCSAVSCSGHHSVLPDVKRVILFGKSD